MGVKGLWDLLRPAGGRTTLQALGREAVEAGRGTFRLGIDASLWIFHSRDIKGGNNPSLRNVFFRTLALLQHPVSPLFVFGGHFGTHDDDSKRFQKMLDIWGLPWLQAPGEAEAELAVLNRAGKIDAILSDDVDAFVFGARAVLRNNSPELSGSKAAMTNQGSSKDVHSREYVLYHVDDVTKQWTADDSELRNESDCQMAMVLVALLAGGDYRPQGVASIGPVIAMGLARSGHGKPLARYVDDPDGFARLLPTWRAELVEELRHDLSGHIGRRYKVMAERLASIDEKELLRLLPLQEYLCPTVTPPEKREQHWRRVDELDAALWRGSITGAARACEEFFEWGTPDLVVKRFSAANSVFSAAVITSVLKSEPLSESPVIRVHDVKPSKADSGTQDVVLDCSWSAFISSCRSAMIGSRPDPSTLPPEVRMQLGLVEVARPTAAQPVVGTSRIKLPQYLVEREWPSALVDYERENAERAASKKGKRKAQAKPRTKTACETNMNIRNFMTQMPPAQVVSSQRAPEPRADSPPTEDALLPPEIASSPVPSIFSKSPPPLRRRADPSQVPTSPSPPPISTSLLPSPPPVSSRRDQPRLFFTDSEASEPETETVRKPVQEPEENARQDAAPNAAQQQEGHPDSDYDDSVVLIDPPALHAHAPPASPSKRGRRAGSKNSSSRSTTPLPKRNAASFARAGSAGVGTKDDPISLSDTDDEDAFPILRAAQSRSILSTRSTAAPKPSSFTAKPRSRDTAPELPPKPKSPPKAKATAPLASSAPPAEQQTLLQGFFKPTAKVGAATASRAKAAKPRKEKKERYRVEEKDGTEVYHFL